MDGYNAFHTRRRSRFAALASAIVLATGIGACDWGGETRDALQPSGPGAEPDPELGASSGDIDIGARSSEAGTAERNEAAARADDAESESLDSALGPEPAEDAPQETQIAAARSTGAVSAAAALEPVGDGQAHGDASFIQTDEGLEIVVTMAGLEPGRHGIHVHENGDCSGPAAEAAGDHFNPAGSAHGAPSDEPSARHAGDLGNLSADASGDAELNLTDEVLTVEGENGVTGRAIIVHGGEDDFSSQPSGESGDPVACGVIEVSARG